ncbi:MAG: GIY-YIG nuclease family protein [Candidatus Omnitrophica bacterium]|nr:GIY-YIG nuclease family protein [Candidatus Omnitrophota bacterium]
MFYTYVLKSKKNGKLYSGHTKNLERRFLEHNSRKDKSKFSYINRPWELMFFETFDTRAEAMKRERFLKSGKGKESIKERLTKN